MRRLIGVALGHVLVMGCPGTHSNAEVACETNSECERDQVCAAVRRDHSVCIPTCDYSRANVCPDGAVCDWDGCLPGSRTPRQECLSNLPCAFGHACSRPLGAPLGTCVPSCADDSECSQGEACLHAVCTQICDARAEDSCPAGYGCTFFGSCLPRDCPPSGDDPDVSNGCAADATCQGWDPVGHCLRAPSEEELAFCGPDAQLGPTYRCYRRSELRPVR